MVEISAQPRKDGWRKFNLPHYGIAASAEQAPNPTRCVAMVNNEIAVVAPTKQTAATLLLAKSGNLRGGQAVFPDEPSAQIFCPGRIRIGSPPFAQSLISPLAIGGPVGAVSFPYAKSALPPGQPVSRVLGGIPIHSTNSAIHRVKSSTAAWHGVGLDQPCHADVLLELANREDAA